MPHLFWYVKAAHVSIIRLNKCFGTAGKEIENTFGLCGIGSFFGVSVGYAYYDEKKADIQAVIEEADEMMYQNKHENI